MKHKSDRFFTLLKNEYPLLAAPLITLAVLLLAFIKSGVVPFGTLSVEYYDMGQGITPGFYHVWDALHRGDVALWFNWYTGLGVNNSNTSLSFFWLVLLVIKRRWVNPAMTLYVLFSFMLSAFTSAVFLKKATKAKPMMVTLLSVCYAFCGFSVMYYTNAWQDTVLLFPLLMLAWHRVMQGKGILPLVFMVMLNFFCGYYVFTLQLLYLFFISFLFIRFRVEKEERGSVSLKLAAGILLGSGISAASTLPKLAQTLSSGRFVEKTGFDISHLLGQYLKIAGTGLPEKYTHYAVFFMMSLPLAVMLYGMVAEKKSGKKPQGKSIFFLLSVALIAWLAVCEGSNLFMHLGDYKEFPIRMGYAVSLLTVWGAAEYSVYIKSVKLQFTKKNLPWLAVNAALFAVLFLGVYLLIRRLPTVDESALSAVLLPLLAVLYAVLISPKLRHIDYRVCLAVLLAETIAFSVTYIPYQKSVNDNKEQDPVFITTTQKLQKQLNIEESKTSRIKAVGTVLNNNYGTVLQRATVADWTHLIPSNVQTSLKHWGYTAQYTRLSDSGGTAFSDALLGVDYVLSPKAEPESLYRKIDKKSKYNYYEANYTIPYAYVADAGITELSEEDKTWQETQNEAYQRLTGDAAPLISESGYTLLLDEGDTETYRFQSEEGTTAYFELEGARKVRVYVNGKRITVPSVAQPNNKRFPGISNRGILCLGDFGNSEVEIKLVFTQGKFDEKSNFRKNDEGEDAYKNQHYHSNVSLLHHDKLKAVCDKLTAASDGITVKAENYTLTANGIRASKNEVLLLPLQYSENSGWQATVNGKPVKLTDAGGVLTAVALEEGENQVSLKFVPPGLKAGAVITLASLLLLAVYLLLEKKKGTLWSFAAKLIYPLYTAAFGIGIALVYLFPAVYGLFQLIKR